MSEYRPHQKGFATFLPILIVAVALGIGIFLTSVNKNIRTTKVLGDKTQVHTPEPADTPEAKDTPEPKDTLEPKQVEMEAEIKDGSGEAKIKIQNGDKNFEFQKDGTNVQVQGNFPLSVNPTTNTLTVTTPAGSKTVDTLPSQAVQSLISQGIISTQSGILLTTDANGQPVYTVVGVKTEKLLGIFNVSIDKTSQVSAQSGQILSTNQSNLSKILDLLSF